MKRNYLIFFMLALLGYLSGFAQEESSKPVYNGDTGYDDLETALSAAAENDVLVVKGELKITKSISPSVAGVTIKGSDNSSLIKCAGGKFVLNGSTANSLAFENITIDGGKNNKADFFEAGANGKTLKFKDVKFQNFKIVPNAKAAVVAKGGGKLELENVEFKDIVNETDFKGCVFIGSPNSKITGSFNGSICIEINNSNNNNKVDVSGINVGSSKVKVYLRNLTEGNLGKSVLINAASPNDFILKNAGYQFNNDNGTLNVTKIDNYDPKVKIGETPYDTLEDALDFAKDGNEIVLFAEQSLTSRLTIGKAVTIKSGAKEGETLTPKTISNSHGDQAFLISGRAVTFENIILDGTSQSEKKNFIGVENNGGVLTLNDVKIQNYKFGKKNNDQNQSCNKLIHVKKGNAVHLNNVTVENVTGPEDMGMLNINGAGSTINGNTNLSIQLNGNDTDGYATIAVADGGALSNTEPIMLYFDDNRKEKNPTLVTNCTDATKFDALEWNLVNEGSNIVLGEKKVFKVTIDGKKGGYNTLKEAYEAAADGDVIVVKENQDLKEQFGNGNRLKIDDKNITVKGENENITLKFENNNQAYVIYGKNVTFENLILDGNNASGRNYIAVENKGTLTLKNVKIANYTSTDANNKLINLKPADEGKDNINKINIENVTVDNVKVPEEVGMLNINNAGSTINGKNNLSIQLNGKATVAVAENGTLTNQTPIDLYVTTHEAADPVITNCKDAAKFAVKTPGFILEADDANTSIKLATDPTYVAPTMVTIEGGKTFDSLQEAIDKAKDGNTILINKDITDLNERITLNKAVTIKGNGEGTRVITNKFDRQAFLVEGKTVIIENIILDGGGQSDKHNFIGVQNKNGKAGDLTLSNVKLQNFKFGKDSNKFIHVKDSEVAETVDAIHLNNVTVENVAGPEEQGMLNINNAGSTINGNNNLSIHLNGNATVAVAENGELTNQTPIDLYVTEHVAGDPVVTNCKDAAKFAVKTPGFILEADETANTLKLAVDPTYVAPTMVTIEGGKTFDSLNEALEKSKDGDVLLINKDIADLNERILINKAVTIKGVGEGTRVITNKFDRQAFIVEAKTARIENIVLDGGGQSDKHNFIGVEDKNGKAADLTLSNVKLQNFKFGKDTNKFIHVKSGEKKENEPQVINAIHLENVTVENVAGPEDQGMLNINSIGSTISGNNNVSIHLNGKNTIAVTGDLTNGAEAPIEIYVSDHEAGDAVVSDCQALDKFKVMTPGFILVKDESNNCIKLAADPDYVAPTKVTIEGGKTFDSLGDALTKAKNGDVLIVNENLEMTDRIFIDKAVTIRGKEGADIVISSPAVNQAFIFNSQGKMAVENIIFDGMDAKGPNFIAVEKDNSDLTLKNVMIRNYSFSGNNLLINVKKSEKAENQIAIHLDGVTVENVTGPDNMMMLNINGDGSTINGNNNLSIKLNGTAKLAVPEGGALTNETPIIVSVGNHQKGDAIVENCGDASRFMAMFWKLAVSDNNVVLAEAEEFPTAVTIEGRVGGYATLEEAIAAASDGDVILVNEPIEIFDTENNATKRLTIDKAVTIKGGQDGIVITNKHKVQAFLISGKHVTFENITLDGDGAKGENYIGVENNNGALTLRDFKLTNYIFENKNGNKLIHVKGGKGNAIHLENALAVNVSGPEGVGMININTDGSTLSGDNNMSIHLNGTSTVAVAEGKELTHTGMITVYTTGHDVASPVVTNCTNTDLFQVPGWEIRSDGVNIVLDKKSAISEIEAGDDSGAPVEFYNLQGVKVSKANLVPGIYIRKQGKKTTKIIIR